MPGVSLALFGGLLSKRPEHWMYFAFQQLIGLNCPNMYWGVSLWIFRDFLLDWRRGRQLLFCL